MKKVPPSKNVTVTETPKPFDWFKAISILLLIVLAIYYFESNDSSEISQRSDYTIAGTSMNNKRGFNISVLIKEKKSNIDLLEIAKAVKHKGNTISENGLVFFLLPEMAEGNGAWARVSFTPDPVVDVLGLSIKDEDAIRASIGNIKDYVGLWINNYSSDQVIIRIRRDKKYRLVSEFISPSNYAPSELASPLRFEKKEGQLIFRDLESDAGDYYLFKANGDLDCYDEKGFIQTYKLLKINSENSLEK